LQCDVINYMRFVFETERSYYEAPTAQLLEVRNWISGMVLSLPFEDKTGEIFIDNFVDPGKEVEMPGGSVNGILLRNRFKSAEPMLTDVIVTDQDVYETNRAAGIFFDVTNPDPGSYWCQYKIMITPNGNDGSMFMDLLVNPQQDGIDFLSFHAKRLHNHSAQTHDHNSMFTIAEDSIGVEFACEAQDQIKGGLRFRPMTVVEEQRHGLPAYLRCIAKVIGIEPPALG
jgi:hypothetical protein